ncbi:MAG: AraC family transcriptional regulator ligand-binding domain-containing protein [Paracoccus sp. (in: a-proteobacteria)]
MGKHYIRARSLTGLAEIAQQRRASLATALVDTGLQPTLLRRPDEPIEFNRYCQLLEHCADAWRLPDLGFRMAPFQHLDILGPVALVTRMERTLRDALNAIMQNIVLFTDALVSTLEERDDVAAIVLAVHGPDLPSRQYMFLALAVAKNVVQQSAGRPVDFIEAQFRETADTSVRTAEAWFGCPARFGAGRNALYFDRDLLDTALERSDLAYHAIIRRYLANERAEIGGSVADAVRGEIARQMELGNCTLETVSRALRIEPRGLQRRLKSEGSSFREMIDHWRRDRSRQLLSMTRLPLSDIADALGYAHQAAFTRAFLRWYGCAPLAFRQRLNEGPDRE